MSEKIINILHLQNHLYISCGISKTIYLIVKNSSPKFNHQIACFDGDGFSRFDTLNIKPLVLKDFNNSLFGFVKQFIKLYSFCKQNEINIIHSHHRYFDLLAFLISRILKVKTVTSVHSKVYNHKFFSYKSLILVACSNSIKDHLNKYFSINEDRIKVIHNAVDPNEFILTKTKSELINELDIPDEKFIIGYFGRLDYKEKGVDILLNSFLNLSKINKDLFLLLVGNGVDENKIREFITQNKLRAKVMNAQSDIFNYYQLIDLFVLPSRVDPFPLVMLEAGLMKKPFVGSRVDGISELIENETDGLLFESGNADDLISKILKIYNDKKYAYQLAENLYSKVLGGYTIQNIIPNYEKLYLSLHDAK
ncbi:MAG TPA: glycosyltransferase family 4 protein [Ignavibacteriaceae bacterium]|nr:glycosyltransferase family 4 protein [Ignavibacteriaceae bacterium]